MKKLNLVVFVLTAGCIWAAEPRPASVPKDAREIAPFTWEAIDAKGAHWTYHQTPFGVSRVPSEKAQAPTPAEEPESIVVTDLGDSYRFERKTIFGPHSWTRKKSQLTADEKTILEDSAVARPAAPEASASTGKGSGTK